MITSRIAWGGPAGPIGSKMVRPALSVTAHHPFPHTLPKGATVAQEIAEVKAIHRFHSSKWLGVGYSFIITQNGNIYEGRGWGRIGAHAGTTTGNETSYGIAFLVNGKIEAPTEEALRAFHELRLEGVNRGYLRIGHVLKFHRDWNDTDCPGKVCEARLRAAEQPTTRVLKLGMKGDDVTELQRLLELEAKYQTGFFGVITAKAVRNFQYDNGLTVDGIVGVKTLAKLRG